MEQNNLPEYIKEYRDQSWQIEILIAGGVVFSLYSVTDVFRSYFFETWPLVNYSSIQILILFFSYLVSRILLFGFIANLGFRAVWLAYLGINFSFPKGIKYEKLSSSKFRKEVIALRPNIVQRVILLEKLCILTYSMAILLTLFSVSVMMSMLSVIFILECFGLYSVTENSYFTYFLSLAIAIINSGLFETLVFRGERNSKFSEVTEGISGILDYLTLAFLFKREFLVIKTNTRKWLFYFLTFFITGTSLFVSVNQLGKYYPFGTFKLKVMDDREFYDLSKAPVARPHMYESNISDGRVIFRGAIQSEIVKDKYLKLFLVSWHRFESLLKSEFRKQKFPMREELKGLTKYENVDTVNTDSLYNIVLNELFTVSISQDTIAGLNWRNYKHPITNEQGYLTYIPIDSLPPTEHELVVDISFLVMDEKRSGTWLTIPFWKE